MIKVCVHVYDLHHTEAEDDKGYNINIISKQRPSIDGNMEYLLMASLTNKQLARDKVMEAIFCELFTLICCSRP